MTSNPQSRSREPQLARGVAGRALFHHQPDAQHLKIFGFHNNLGRLPHLFAADSRQLQLGGNEA
jgi:hypothetical protein